MSAHATVRLFFGYMPDERTRARAVAATAALALRPTARLIPSGNLHVTLAFVGEVPASQLASLCEMGRTHRGARFTLRMDACEHWSNPGVVVGVARATPRELAQSWRQLHRDLGQQRLALEPKGLRPHVTLARKVMQAPVLQPLVPFDWPVRELSLVRSDLGGMHSAYTVVDTWPLLDEPEKT